MHSEYLVKLERPKKSKMMDMWVYIWLNVICTTQKTARLRWDEHHSVKKTESKRLKKDMLSVNKVHLRKTTLNGQTCVGCFWSYMLSYNPHFTSWLNPTVSIIVSICCHDVLQCSRVAESWYTSVPSTGFMILEHSIKKPCLIHTILTTISQVNQHWSSLCI